MGGLLLLDLRPEDAGSARAAPARLQPLAYSQGLHTGGDACFSGVVSKLGAYGLLRFAVRK